MPGLIYLTIDPFLNPVKDSPPAVTVEIPPPAPLFALISTLLIPPGIGNLSRKEFALNPLPDIFGKLLEVG